MPPSSSPAARRTIRSAGPSERRRRHDRAGAGELHPAQTLSEQEVGRDSRDRRELRRAAQLRRQLRGASPPRTARTHDLGDPRGDHERKRRPGHPKPRRRNERHEDQQHAENARWRHRPGDRGAPRLHERSRQCSSRTRTLRGGRRRGRCGQGDGARHVGRPRPSSRRERSRRRSERASRPTRLRAARLRGRRKPLRSRPPSRRSARRSDLALRSAVYAKSRPRTFPSPGQKQPGSGAPVEAAQERPRS